MKFSGQKFFILLGLFLIPILFVGALLREPVVNRGLLRVTLSVLKKRVGASLKAQTWKVDLSKFAVAVEGIEFKHKDLIISAKELRAEVSPLFLLVGRIYFSKVWANEVSVLGKIDLPKKPKDEKPFHLENEVSDAATQMVEIQELLEKKKIGFELFELSGLKMNTDLVQVEGGDLNIENYGVGHVKTELALDRISSKEKIPSLEKLQASVVLYRDRNSAYLSIRKLNAELQNKEYLHTTLETKGRIPGDITVDFVSDLSELKKWMSLQPLEDLKNFAKKNKFGGYLELRGNGLLEGKGLKQADLKTKARSLIWGDMSIASLESTVEVKGSEWKVARIEGKFHPTRLDKKAKNGFVGKDLVFENDRVSGELTFDRTGLCAVLRGVGVKDCHLDLILTGKIDLGGTLKPLKIVPQLDLKTEPFEVFTEPDFAHQAASGRLLRAKPAHVTGFVEARESEIDVSELRARFSESAFIEARGKIKYSPTQVFLRVTAEQTKAEDMIHDFLTLAPKGLIKADVTVDYDIRRPKEFGKTDFFADYLIRGLTIADLPLGDASGKLHFMRKMLEFKPTIRNGPGILKVTGQIGNLEPGNGSSQMAIYAEATDYEILVPADSGPPIFDGIFNFETHLRGSLDETAPKPFGGNVNAKIHSLTSFGIPFENGQISSYVDLSGLKIEKLLAYKGDVKTELTGFLGPKNSRVDFASDFVPIRQVGYLPEFEKLAQEGELKANGFWDQSKGWAINANTRNLRVGANSYPILDLKFEGSKEGKFFANVESGEDIQIRYDSQEESFKAKLKDSGIFLALTLINKWERIPEFLKIAGDIDIFWAKNSGQIDLKSFDIQVTDRFNLDDRQLIKLDVPSKIFYQDGLIRGGASFSSGYGGFNLFGEKDELLAKGILSVRLFDLLLPDFVRLVDGSASMSARWNAKTYNLVADAKLENTTAYIAALGSELRAVSGDVRYANNRVYFKDVSGRSGDAGEFTLQGDMAANASEMNLKSNMDALSMRIGRDVELVLSGDMELSGKNQPFALKGRARIEKGLLRKEFSGSAIRTAILEKPFLSFDVPFEVLSGFQVKNSLADAFVVGKGRLLGNDLSPVISGRFDVVKGNLLAKDTEFTVNFARVDLPVDPSFDPIIVNVQASTLKSYQGIDYRIFLAAEGDPDDLRLNFRSEPSLSQRELIALLTLGYVPQEQPVGSQGATIAQSASAEAFQLLFGQALGKGIQKQTGFDVRVGTSANLKQEDTIPKVSVYRKLGERVSATFGRSLDVSRPENNFQVDYRLLKNLNLTGVWENPEENRHSMGLDLRLEFEIK